jgi:hypothetical protein
MTGDVDEEKLSAALSVSSHPPRPSPARSAKPNALPPQEEGRNGDEQALLFHFAMLDMILPPFSG